MQAIHTDYNSGTSPVMFPTYSMSMNFQPQPHSSQHQQLHQSHHHQQVHQPQQHQQQYSLSPMSPTHQLYDSDPSGSSSSSMVQRRRSGGSGAPSGASRRVSPDAMIPLDAPTQPRRYLTPSATSRKDVPAFFKRGSYGGSSRLSDDEEDELADEPPLAPNATDQERIQWKRRQNTLAARRSRKRKLLQQQALEETAERLARERDVWKTRAETLRRLLISNGIICPDFED